MARAAQKATTTNPEDIAKEAVAKLTKKGEAALADIAERSRHYLDEASERAHEAYGRAAEPVEEHARHAVRRGREGFEATESFVRENPMAIGLTGLATGIMLGVLLMSCRR